jgi:hypothetical protein
MKSPNNPVYWHAGPPPHIGWWNASVCSDLEAWRWWDGTRWSKAAYPDEFWGLEEIQMWAETPASEEHQQRVRWTHLWPDNALVPRINPATKK